MQPIRAVRHANSYWTLSRLFSVIFPAGKISATKVSLALALSYAGVQESSVQEVNLDGWGWLGENALDWWGDVARFSGCMRVWCFPQVWQLFGVWKTMTRCLPRQLKQMLTEMSYCLRSFTGRSGNGWHDAMKWDLPQNAQPHSDKALL